jgi:hypothetical protein
MIGALAPLKSPYWLGASPVLTLGLGPHRYLGAEAEDLPIAAVRESGARLRRGLLIYEGGQA